MTKLEHKKEKEKIEMGEVTMQLNFNTEEEIFELSDTLVQSLW